MPLVGIVELAGSLARLAGFRGRGNRFGDPPDGDQPRIGSSDSGNDDGAVELSDQSEA